MVTQGCRVPLRRVILFSCSATCDVGVCLVAQLCPTPGDPMTLLPVGILQARILEWVAVPSSRDLPDPGIKPRSPVLQVDSLPGTPKNTGVGFPLQPRNRTCVDGRGVFTTEPLGKPSRRFCRAWLLSEETWVQVLPCDS